MCRARGQHEACGRPHRRLPRRGGGGGGGGREFPSPALPADPASAPSPRAGSHLSPPSSPRMVSPLPPRRRRPPRRSVPPRRRGTAQERDARAGRGNPSVPPLPRRAPLSRELPHSPLCPPAGGGPLSREPRGSHASAVVSEGRAQALSGRRAPPRACLTGPRTRAPGPGRGALSRE